MLDKIEEMEKVNTKLLKTISESKNENFDNVDNIKSDIKKDIPKSFDDNDMRKDLLDFVESNSFYDIQNSFSDDYENNQKDKNDNIESNFNNISNTNYQDIINNNIINNDSSIKNNNIIKKNDNITLQNSKYDKMSKSTVYYSDSANENMKTIKRDSWKYDNDTITSGNIPIEGSLYAYDNSESNYAAI